MKRILLGSIFLLFSSGIFAQELPLTISYYGPYFLQYGGNIGTSIPLKSISKEAHQFRLEPSIGYFERGRKQRNVNLRIQGQYFYYNDQKSWHPTGGISLSYIQSWQETGGSVNLGSGEIDYDLRTISQIAPCLNLGYRYHPSAKYNFSFQLFYGPAIDLNGPNAGFFGLEIGMSYNFNTTAK